MILITGATGQVGTALIAELQQQQLAFRALAHTPASYDRLAAQQVAAVLADDTQPAALLAAFADVEQFFLLTPSSPDQVAIERRLVDAARQAGVRQVVYLSALGAGDPSVSMLRAHREVEQYIQQSDVGYTILRPNPFMQNFGNREAGRIKQQHLFANSVGDSPVSFIDTRDIAAVAVAVLRDDRHIGQTYELTGPETLSYGQVAQKLTALLEQPIQYVALGDDAYRAALLSAGVPAWNADGLAALYRFYREGKGAVVTDVVAQVTGRSARSLDSYLAEHTALFR